MATIKTKPIYRFYEFASPFRMERREDGSEVLVQPGYAFVNETVPGDRYYLKRSAMQAATDGYREWEALREMHQPLAAGFVPKLEWDERGAYIEAHVVDPVAQQKVRTGTYKGFSVGVTPTLVNRANEVESCEWVEISLVDRPKDPHAVFTLARVLGLDPDAEVDVEVVEDTGNDAATSLGTTASPAAPQQPAAAPDGDLIASTPSSAASEVTPVVPDPEAAGASSHTEEERAALLASGLPEGMLAGVEVVQAGEERALGSPVVPVRENLAGGPTPTMDDVLGERFPEGYRVEQAANGKWCAYGGGVKLGEFDSEAEARARVTDAQAAMKGSDDPAPGYRAANVTPERVEAITAELTGILARATALQQELAGEAPAALPAPAAAATERYMLRRMGERCYSIYDATKNELVTRFFDGRVILRFETSEAAEAYLAERRFALKDEADQEWPSVVAQRAITDSETRWANAPEPAVEEPPPAATGERYTIRLSRDGALQSIYDATTQSYIAQWFSNPEDAAAKLAELRAAAVEEPPPAAPETVSRSIERDDPTEIQRLQTANSELTQRLADHEKVLTRLAASEAEVKRLGSLPLDRQKPVVRYPHALSREFIANLGNEAEAETQRMRREYDEAAAEAKAERNGDRDKLNRATEMMILRASQLAERGVFV